MIICDCGTAGPVVPVTDHRDDRGGRVTALTVEYAAQLFVNPSSYTDETALEAALALPREKAPVVRVDHPSYRPLWAVTQYADIVEVLRNHELWHNDPRSVLQSIELDDALDAMRDAGVGLRNPVHVDGKYHRALRAIGAEWFRPRVMRSLKHRIDELATHHVLSYPSANRDADVFTDPSRAKHRLSSNAVSDRVTGQWRPRPRASRPRFHLDAAKSPKSNRDICGSGWFRRPSSRLTIPVARRVVDHLGDLSRKARTLACR